VALPGKRPAIIAKLLREEPAARNEIDAKFVTRDGRCCNWRGLSNFVCVANERRHTEQASKDVTEQKK